VWRGDLNYGLFINTNHQLVFIAFAVFVMVRQIDRCGRGRTPTVAVTKN